MSFTLRFSRKIGGSISLEGIEKLPLSVREHIDTLDLSCYRLSDKDLPAVFNIMQLLPKCSALDLTACLLNSSKGPQIAAFTRLPALKYLFLWSTGLADFGARHMFAELEARDVAKIIFLDSLEDLEHSAWKNTVTNASMHPVVERTHREFFDTCCDPSLRDITVGDPSLRDITVGDPSLRDNVEAFALTPEFLANWKEDVDAANWKEDATDPNPDTIISAFWAQVDYQKVCDPTNHDPSLYHGDSEIVAFYKMIFLCQ